LVTGISRVESLSAAANIFAALAGPMISA